MRLIGLSVRDNDDRQFISLIQKLIHGVVQSRMPKVYCVVRVHNWFGHRWLNFSGKMLGALSVRKFDRTTFPPFVPNRLRNYAMCEWSDEKNDYVELEDPPLVHKRQRSSENFQNFVDRTYPDSAFFWFSGSTKLNGRGTVMGYVTTYPVGATTWTWYLEFSKEAGWKHSKAINITPEQVQFYIEKRDCPVKAGR